ncbi:hypothetical protein ACFQ0K_12190 [Nocardioides caeni]|uniref:Lipoprotein n=1 Tax=Nocardioides caeni TaxID=574700 RepID=A0A4S8NNF6_9ACTN|nr:hypothetical protein [Nocardioides caeni]THV17802.1 hypothetical protein E9934_04880 [Nocardioides caeni]
MHQHRFRKAFAVATVIGTSTLALTACSSEPRFAEGDCVTLDPGLVDAELEEADCSNNAGVLTGDEAVYEVYEVIDGTDGSCSSPQGFFPVEFTDEPDDAIYCLVLADGS